MLYIIFYNNKIQLPIWLPILKKST